MSRYDGRAGCLAATLARPWRRMPRMLISSADMIRPFPEANHARRYFSGPRAFDADQRRLLTDLS